METPAEKVFIGEKIVKKPLEFVRKGSGTKPIFLMLWKICMQSMEIRHLG